MQIHIDYEGCDPLFEAILQSPFTSNFKKLLIDEIRTAPGLRFGKFGVLGFFDGSDISALGDGTGDFVTRARLSRAGELMTAALRALRASPEKKESQ